MKVTFYSTILDYLWGGADALWTRAAEEAIRRGDKVQLVISPLTAKHPRIQALCEQGASLCLREGQARKSLLGRLGTKLGYHYSGVASRKIREFSPDRIIVSQGSSFCGIYDDILLAFLDRFNGELVLLNNAQSEHPYLSNGDAEKVKYLYGRADTVFFVSQRNLKVTERILLQRLDSAHILHYPVLESKPEFSWPASDEANFASVARYDIYDKGFDLLLPALSELTGHNVPWSLSIFGRGKDEQYIRQAIRYYGLEGRASLMGFTEDVNKVYEGHHMLLLPSRIEGCALAMTEALLRGRPVLATDVAAAGEWITDDYNGYLCPSLTEESIHKSIQHALDNRGTWETLGRRALEAAWTQYRPDDYTRLLG